MVRLDLVTSEGSIFNWDEILKLRAQGSDCLWLVKALEREGGAREVAAGGTFCVAVTNSGSVLSWGSLPGALTEYQLTIL